MMHDALMKLIQQNEESILEDLVQDIRGRHELQHYHAFSGEVLAERLHHVCQNAYKRFSTWLSNNTSKNVAFAYYTGMGRQRHQEGIPLEEVIMVLFIIKKKIYDHGRAHASLVEGDALHGLLEALVDINAFFDEIAFAIIVGYREGNAIRACA